jgi:hypothetical protein
MFVQDTLFALNGVIKDKFPLLKFFLMFAAVVIAPLILFTVSGHNNNLINQPSLFWPLFAIASILIMSIGGGILLFKCGGSTPNETSIL